MSSIKLEHMRQSDEERHVDFHKRVEAVADVYEKSDRQVINVSFYSLHDPHDDEVLHATIVLRVPDGGYRTAG